MGVYVAHERNRALAASTAKTMIQLLNPSTRRLQVVEWGVSFDGVTATDIPVDVDLLRQTTTGTMTDFGTEIPWDPAEVASVVTATVNATVEPTASDILSSHQVTPNGGNLVMPYDDAGPIVAASGRIGLRCTPGAALTATNCTAYIRWREIG